MRTRDLLTDAVNTNGIRKSQMVIRFISILVIGAALLGTTLIVVAPQQSEASHLTSARF